MANEDELARVKAERNAVRAQVYDLGVRLNAGDESVRGTLDAAIERSDELAREIERLDPPPVYNGPPATMYGPPVAPMYGPPPVGGWSRRDRTPPPSPPSPRRRGILDRLFRRK